MSNYSELNNLLYFIELQDLRGCLFTQHLLANSINNAALS